MSCKVNRVFAPNGEPSKLYSDLLAKFKDQNLALDIFVSTRTNAFKKVFGDWTSEDYEGKLDVNGEPLMTDVIRKEYIEDQDILDASKRDSKNYMKSITKVESLVNSTRDVLIRRIIELERNTGKGSEVIKGKLNKLKKNLKILDWRKVTIEFSAAAAQNIDHAEKRIDSELAKKEPNAKVLHRFNNMLTAFDVLEEMRDEIRANSIMLESMQEELKVIDSLIGIKEGAKKKYNNFMEDRVAEVLASKSFKYSTEELRQFLKRAPQDIKSRERWLMFAGDSSDTTIALVAKLVNEQQQKTRHTSITFTRSLSEKLEAMEKERSQFKGNAEKMYDPMLERDSKGKLTGYIVHPKKSKPQYDKFKAEYEGTATFEFYNFFLSNYERLNSYLPSSSNMEHRLPTLLKSTLEGVLSQDNKLDKVANHVINSIEATNTDLELGQLTDDSHQAVNSIPIHFTQNYDSSVFRSKYRELIKNGVAEADARKQATDYARAKLPENISYDLGASLQAFEYMAENYANLNEIIDVVEGAKSMLYNRELTVTNAQGKPFITNLTDMFGDKIGDTDMLIKGSESNAYKMIEAYIASQVYGQTEEDLGNFQLGNMQIDTRKLLKNIMSANSSIMIGFNVMAGTSNILMGESMQWADAFGGEYYNSTEYLKSTSIYAKELPKILGDVVERYPKSIVNVLAEHYDFLGDYFPGGVGASDSSAVRRAAKSGSIFFINSMGEHLIQCKAAIAMLLHTKTYDENGKEIGNLYESHTVKDGVLTIPDNIYIEVAGVKVKYGKVQQYAMSRKIQTVLRKMHGNYNSQTAAAWQRNAVYGLVGQFRKWIYEGWVRRTGKGQPNEFLEQDIEGNYRSFGKFVAGLIGDLSKSKFENALHWKDMTNHQKANVKRTTAEIGFVVVSAVSLAILKSLAEGLDDDKDKKMLAALRFNMYLANRLQTELMFFVSPLDAWQIFKSPAAVMSMTERVTQTLYYGLPWNWDEKYEAGVNKDKNKFINNATKLIPLYKNIEKLSPNGIKGQVEYFNIN